MWGRPKQNVSSSLVPPEAVLKVVVHGEHVVLMHCSLVLSSRTSHCVSASEGVFLIDSPVICPSPGL